MTMNLTKRKTGGNGDDWERLKRNQEAAAESYRALRRLKFLSQIIPNRQKRYRRLPNSDQEL